MFRIGSLTSRVWFKTDLKKQALERKRKRAAPRYKSFYTPKSVNELIAFIAASLGYKGAENLRWLTLYYTAAWCL